MKKTVLFCSIPRELCNHYWESCVPYHLEYCMDKLKVGVRIFSNKILHKFIWYCFALVKDSALRIRKIYFYSMQTLLDQTIWNVCLQSWTYNLSLTYRRTLHWTKKNTQFLYVCCSRSVSQKLHHWCDYLSSRCIEQRIVPQSWNIR